MNYDSILVVSFGGPESREEVIPFLENVLRGRSVPRERMLAVAEHYYHFEGRSPINQQTRDLIVLVPVLADLDEGSHPRGLVQDVVRCVAVQDAVVVAPFRRAPD